MNLSLIDFLVLVIVRLLFSNHVPRMALVYNTLEIHMQSVFGRPLNQVKLCIALLMTLEIPQNRFISQLLLAHLCRQVEDPFPRLPKLLPHNSTCPSETSITISSTAAAPSSFAVLYHVSIFSSDWFRLA